MPEIIELQIPRQPTVTAEIAVALVGAPGPIGDAGGAFLVANKFYEIAADEAAKQVARENLGLSVIDGGTFF